MPNSSLFFCDADQQYVTACLGRSPQGVVGVAARRPTGEPTVIINRPLIPKKEAWHPVPTLYWLVDPDLNVEIASIERKGGVGEIEQAIAEDTTRQLAHRDDNVFYAMARWALLNEQERKMVTLMGARDMLKYAGVSGVSNHDAVKCLHAQYAFHLARREVGSTVGKLMDSRYGLSAENRFSAAATQRFLTTSSSAPPTM